MCGYSLVLANANTDSSAARLVALHYCILFLILIQSCYIVCLGNINYQIVQMSTVTAVVSSRQPLLTL